jgi:Holliday junction resolvase
MDMERAAMDGELRAVFRHHLPRVGWTTIETAAVEPGVPDLNGCFDGVEFWVEMKQTEGWTVEVKAAQVAWHKLRQSKGGRTFFAVRRKRTDLYLIHGRHADVLKTEGLKTCPALLHYGGGPSEWGWVEVLCTLLGR